MTKLAAGATKSWRTTVAGVVQFLAVAFTQVSALLDDDQFTEPNWNLVLTSGAVLVGLLMARDNSVSSEGAGAK